MAVVGTGEAGSVSYHPTRQGVLWRLSLTLAGKN